MRVISACFVVASAQLAHADEVRTIDFDELGLELTNPQFVAIYEDLAFVAAGEANHIGVVDLNEMQAVRAIEMIEDMGPYRIISAEDGTIAAIGGKYVAIFDAKPLLESPDANLEVLTFCIIDCSRPKDDISATAITFPPDFSIEDMDFPYVTVVDREEGIGVMMQVDEQAITPDGDLAEIMDEITSAGGDFLSLGNDLADIASEGETTLFTVPADVTGTSLLPEAFIEAAPTDPSIGVRFEQIAEVGDSEGMRILKGGSTAIVVDQAESRIRFVSLPTGEVETIVHTGIPGITVPFEFIPYPGDTVDLALTKDEDFAFVSNVRSSTIAKVDLSERRVSDMIRLPDAESGPYGIALSPNDRFLLVAAWGTDELLVIDVQSGEIVRRVQVGHRPVGVAVSEEGHVVVANSEDATVSVVTLSGLDLVGAL